MKRLFLAVALVYVTLALGTQPAHAVCNADGPVCVTVTPDPTNTNFATLASNLGLSSDELTHQLMSQVNNLFQTSDVGAFLRDFQNAQSFSAKGLGVDYASEATLAEVGATLSFASNIQKAYKPSGSYSDPPLAGGGANFSLMGGLGLGLIGLDPLMIFGNWFKGSASLGQLDGNYKNWGLHGQLRILGPSRKSSATKFLVRWGGIAITSGADYSRLSLSSHKQIKSTINVPSNIPGADSAPVALASDVNGNLVFELQQTTWSVPLEITTSLRLLSLVTLYGGLGIDWQLGGGSDLTLSMQNASVTSKANGASLGTVTIDATGHAKPSAARLREIIGVQLGIFDFVRLFVQVNTTGGSPMLTSVAAGLRLAI
jgi:hypothetical protein